MIDYVLLYKCIVLYILKIFFILFKNIFLLLMIAFKILKIIMIIFFIVFWYI